MKVGIITFHAALNYGSALQAFALQEYLSGRGHDVHMIDFRSKAQERLYPAPVSFSSIYNAKRTILRLFSDWEEFRSMSRKRKAFRKFQMRNMNLTDRHFCTEADLRSYDWSQYDIIVSGSDQIWNVSAIDFSFAYMLDFCEGVRKVAYAPSMGPSPLLPESVASDVCRLISGYEAVSVREQAAVECLLSSGLCIEGKAPVLPDPALLNDMEFYRSISEQADPESEFPGYPGDGRYVLLYSPGKCSREAEMLAEAAASGMMGQSSASILPERDRLGIVRVKDGAQAGRESHKGVVCVNDMVAPCGPAGFLWLIDHASCCVGTSFHLMVFSMISGKDFWCPDAASDSRKRQILEALGLNPENRFFSFGDPALQSRIESFLNECRTCSGKFFSSLGI